MSNDNNDSVAKAAAETEAAGEFFAHVDVDESVAAGEARRKAELVAGRTNWLGSALLPALLLLAVAIYVASRSGAPVPCLCTGGRRLVISGELRYPLHTVETHRKQSCIPVKDHELRTGLIIGAHSLDDVVTELIKALMIVNGDGLPSYAQDVQVKLNGNLPMLCMHDLNHKMGGERRICVMRRQQEDLEFIPMINPELKGYSDSNSSAVSVEHPLSCQRQLKARMRRLVVDIGFIYPGPQPRALRLLLDNEKEAAAFQMQWDEMRGVYNCTD